MNGMFGKGTKPPQKKPVAGKGAAMAGAKAMFMGGGKPPGPGGPMMNGDEQMMGHSGPPMDRPQEEQMEPGEPAYDVLSEAAKRVFEEYLQAGQVPDPTELESQGLSPREAEDVTELLEDTLGGM